MNPDKSDFLKKIEDSTSENDPFPPDAYRFLHDALDFSMKFLKKTPRDQDPHISAHDLLDGFRRLALKEFGPMSLTVFEYWGIHSCEDVGKMVFDLVDKGIFTVTENDTLESFRNAYDFDAAFTSPFLPAKKN